MTRKVQQLVDATCVENTIQVSCSLNIIVMDKNYFNAKIRKVHGFFCWSKIFCWVIVTNVNIQNKNQVLVQRVNFFINPKVNGFWSQIPFHVRTYFPGLLFCQGKRLGDEYLFLHSIVHSMCILKSVGWCMVPGIWLIDGERHIWVLFYGCQCHFIDQKSRFRKIY